MGQGLRDEVTERIPTLNAGQTKTVLALVAGIVADRGWIELDAPLGRYLPPGLGDKAHRKVTLRQLMQLTSGVAVDHVQGLNFLADQSRSREYFAMELRHKPGSYFEFDETTPSVLVDVLMRVIAERRDGQDFQDFLQQFLFDPIGIPSSAWFWQRDRSGTTTGYSPFFPGNAGGPGDHEFFRLLMDSVLDMPDSVRASIANSGEYDRPINGDYDLDPAFEPPGAFAGSYLGVGPQAPVGCTVHACEGERNDGLRWLGDVPRAGPGILGLENRPTGR